MAYVDLNQIVLFYEQSDLLVFIYKIPAICVAIHYLIPKSQQFIFLQRDINLFWYVNFLTYSNTTKDDIQYLYVKY